MTAALPRILCVDDIPAVLTSIGITLRKEYDVHTATSGDQRRTDLSLPDEAVPTGQTEGGHRGRCRATSIGERRARAAPRDADRMHQSAYRYPCDYGRFSPE